MHVMRWTTLRARLPSDRPGARSAPATALPCLYLAAVRGSEAFGPPHPVRAARELCNFAINKDGISGRPHQVWSREQQKVMLGRFGWKAGVPDLERQGSSFAWDQPRFFVA